MTTKLSERPSIYPVYVINTDVLLRYPDIIPGKGWKAPIEPKIDFIGKHIVIPMAVVQEISDIAEQESVQAPEARLLLKRLRKITSGHCSSLSKVYEFEHIIAVDTSTFSQATASHDDSVSDSLQSKQMITILPVRKEYYMDLPFSPHEDDNEGHVLMTTIVAGLIIATSQKQGIYFPESLKLNNAILVTNKDGLAVRARGLGLRTAKYSHR